MGKSPTTLDQLLDNPELPSLPEAFLRLNDFIKHDRPIAEITKVIERDPSLAARSLKLANSAWYKRSRTIATVKEAITTIGLDALHQLVFATSVIRSFHGIDKNDADMRSFWQQSIQLACTAKLIRETGGDKNAVTIFTAGTVTYIGKLIIYMTLPDQSRIILENSRECPQLQHLEETKILGFSHNDVTAALLKKWQIPEIIHIPIQHYTNALSSPAEYLPSAAALFLGHQLVFRPADQLDFADPELQQAMGILGISADQLPALEQQADAERTQAASILDIPASPHQ